MKKIALLLLTAFAGFMVTAQTGVYLNQENLRSDTIDVLDYEIHLDLTDYSGKTLSGFTKITFSPKVNNVSTINLDLLKFNIDSVVVNATNLSYSYNDTLLHVNLGNTYNSGDNVELVVYYNGLTQKDPSGWGGIYFGNNYIFNLGVGFEDNPHNIGRYWYPCFDNFKERTTYNLYLTTLDNQYATSIGDLVSSTPKPNNKMEWYWKMDESIPTYLAMFAVNYYTVVTDSYNGINGPIPINLYAKASDTANLKGSFTNLKLCMDAFEGLYGPYQFNKIGYTVVNFSSGAMEHASNITYPNNAVNGSVASEDLMAHELSHQWWGNYATTLTPQDMWLNEGMASFSANYFIEYIYGWETAKVGVKSTLFDIVKKAHIDEGGYLAISGVPHELTYGDHVYRKGSLVAQNLRMLLGENNFGTAVTGFLNSRAYDNMTSLQFRDYLQTTTTADVNGFFDGWVFNGGFPDYEIDSVIITPTPALNDVIVNISQKLNHAPSPFSEMPLEIGFYDSMFNLTVEVVNAGPNTTQYQTSLPFVPVMVTLNPNNKLCFATTEDTKTIHQPGAINFSNAMMNITVNTISDSALLRIEHHWVAPDAVKDFQNKPYRLSNYRYWKVDGILPADFDASASFFFDGRANSGYLDSLLVNTTSDSLVLLYRANAQGDWVEFQNYTKTNFGGATSKFGLIEVSSLIKGEYTFANIDHTVLGIGENSIESPEFNIYPNPTADELTFSWSEDLNPNYIDIYTMEGKHIKTLETANKNQYNFSGQSLGKGQYIARVNTEHKTFSKSFIVQ